MAAIILAFLFGKDWTDISSFLKNNFAPNTQNHPILHNNDVVNMQQVLDQLVKSGQILVQNNQHLQLGTIDSRANFGSDLKTKYYDFSNHSIVVKRIK
ncbi:MAG TPA: hypothetical protein VGZ90_13255 [Puia sp.]|jgi:hypothetical protein|nr:hypothetical protein [Puia sp.]